MSEKLVRGDKAGNFQEISRMCRGNFQEISRNFQEVSGKFLKFQRLKPHAADPVFKVRGFRSLGSGPIGSDCPKCAKVQLQRGIEQFKSGTRAVQVQLQRGTEQFKSVT